VKVLLVDGEGHTFTLPCPTCHTHGVVTAAQFAQWHARRMGR
jgi:hypothetical protein